MTCIHCEGREIPDGLDCSWCLGGDHMCDEDCEGLRYEEDDDGPVGIRGTLREALRLQLALWDAEAAVERQIGHEVDDLSDRIQDVAGGLGDASDVDDVSGRTLDWMVARRMEA